MSFDSSASSDLDFAIASVPGNEHVAIARVTQLAEQLRLPQLQRDQLGTAVGEAVLNAIEHGNKSRAEIPVRVSLEVSAGALVVRITDQGSGGAIIRHEIPDLEAKLAGRQRTRGWGLFLIEHMVDELRVFSDENGHTVELVLYLDTEPGTSAEPRGSARGGRDDAK